MLKLFQKNKVLEKIPENIEGIPVRVSKRARRLSLRLDQRKGHVILIWPLRTRAESALRFVQENRGWIEKQRKKPVSEALFREGARLSLQDVPFHVTHAPGRGLTSFEGDKIVVRGRAEHLPRRLKDFLKAQAFIALQAVANEKAAGIGLMPSAIRVADPRTRWGSCAPDGRMMFSWRLLLAPAYVLDYVVAHEVAHRVHLNHGRKFWMLCAALSQDMEAARLWLRRHGPGLMSAH